jgi:hypothetical protein
MTKMLGVLVLVAGCAGMEMDEVEVGESAMELGSDQVAAMNQAAQGTGIRYALTTPSDPRLPQTLTAILSASAELRRVSRHLLPGHVADVVVPPDPCKGDRCVGPSLRLGPATTAWVPPDPCIPPDPCRTSFDLAGGNLRVIGTGESSADGFALSFQVIDPVGNVVFDSEAY